MNNPLEIASMWLVANLHWSIRSTIGLALPLLVSVYCLTQIIPKMKARETLVWLFACIAGWRLFFETSRMVVHKTAEGVAKGVTMPVHYAIWLAVLAAGVAALSDKKISWKVIFPAVFLPLWSIDMIGATRLFPGDYSKLFTAVGGAGPLDALLLAPVMACLLSKMFEWEVRRTPAWIAWAKSLWDRALKRVDLLQT